jgi:hypothetical protein
MTGLQLATLLDCRGSFGASITVSTYQRRFDYSIIGLVCKLHVAYGGSRKGEQEDEEEGKQIARARRSLYNFG